MVEGFDPFQLVEYRSGMVIMADSQRRITLPAAIKPGDAFVVQKGSHGELLLAQTNESQGGVTLVKKDGLLLATNGKEITWEQTRELLDEFP